MGRRPKSIKKRPSSENSPDNQIAAVALRKLGSSEQPHSFVGNMGFVGPGLVTGASDDDPSGIATYSQAGAQFGFATLWLTLFSYPFMCAIQEISARIGRVTGVGISANIRKAYPRPVVYGIVALLLISSIFNFGADLGAMGESAHMLLGVRRGCICWGWAWCRFSCRYSFPIRVT